MKNEKNKNKNQREEEQENRSSCPCRPRHPIPTPNRPPFYAQSPNPTLGSSSKKNMLFLFSHYTGHRIL